jgi:exonuclease SbcC
VKILRVLPCGFFGFARHAPIEFANRGVVLLQGPVGAGKTSLLDALCEILYGQSPKREGTRDVTETDIVNRKLKMAFGVVELEVSGYYYRVAYLRNWKGPSLLTGPSAQEEAGGYSGTSLYLEWWSGSSWLQQGPDGKDLRYPKMSDTWERISEVIGVDYATFCSSSYIAQDHALVFIRGKNSEREEILTKLMRLSVYDDAEARSKERGAVSKATAERHKVAIATLTAQEQGVQLGDPKSFETRVESANLAIRDLTTQLNAMQEKLSAVAVMEKARNDELNQLRSEQNAALQQIYAKAAQSDKFKSSMDKIRQTAQLAISVLPATSAGLIEATDARLRAKATAESENLRLTSMLPGAGKCPSCGSVLDEQTLASHKDEQAVKVNAALAEMAKAEVSEGQARVRLQDDNLKKSRELEGARDRQLAEVEAQLITAAGEILQLEGTKVQLQAMIRSKESVAVPNAAGAQDLARLNDNLRKWGAEKASAEAGLQLHAQRVADRDRLVAERQVQEVKLAEADLEAQEWAWLAKHLPRVKQLKFASGSSHLNEALARHLDVLTNGSTRVVISPFRPKKDAIKKADDKRTADDYIFEFSMVVEEDEKEDVPIQLYSGGEKERIVLALVNAFWDLARSQGGGADLLLLDEAICFLNEESIERVVQLVEGLKTSVGTVVIIGHDPALASLLSPDEVWMTTKRDGATTIEVRRR